MATIQTIKVVLQRDSLQTPWGFRLQGGADFRTPFAVNKIGAGSPSDGHLHRGDLILEINHQPIGSMFHADALELIQRAGGQLALTLQRGSNNHPLISPVPQPQRPLSAMPWSYGNASPPWSPSANPLSPMSYFRNRPLERIPEPKPLLSQTGSPIMPGPVPSVSTKTRGYIQPPSFHTERADPSLYGSYSAGRFVYPGPSYHPRNRTMSTSSYQHPGDSSWRNSISNESDIYVPSYQKKVQINPNVHKQPIYSSPASSMPSGNNFVHRQFNSPLSLYSNDNVQEVLNHHINRNTTLPSLPEQNYHVTLLPSTPTRAAMTLPVQYVSTNPLTEVSDF